MAQQVAVWTALNSDWAALCEANAGRPLPPSWAEQLPERALPPCTRAANQLDDLRDLVRERDDDIACGLLRLIQTGDHLAGRVIVQALLPRLWSMSRRDPRHDMGDYVDVAWTRLLTYPVDQRTQSVLVNIALDCLKLVTRQDGCRRRETCVTWLTEPATPVPARVNQPLWGDADTSSVRDYVDALLDLADRDGWASPKATAVLRSVYIDGMSGHEAAARHAISHDMVRYHCSHTIKSLRTHRQEVLQALGSW